LGRCRSGPQKCHYEYHSHATLGIAGGGIYDAFHVSCARKVNAEITYTWNIRDFQRVAPDLADRIVTR
jgi:hypothetical protein